jgi:hypothetical protein
LGTEVAVAGSNVANNANKFPLNLFDYIIQPSSFWSKEVWEELGGLNIEMHFCFDWEWFLRAEASGIIFRSVDNTLSLYRIHRKHKSGNGGKEREDELAQVYQVFAGVKIVSLYRDLISINKKLDEENFFLKIKRKIINRFIKVNSEGEMIKKIYPNLFYNYSLTEINAVLKMVK